MGSLADFGVEALKEMQPAPMRTFDTGATRDTDEGKIHYKGFLSRKAMRLFGTYMEKHRVQRDGSLRDPDNWKKGIPLAAYEDSGDRHWQEFMGYIEDGDRGPRALDALLAHYFNVQGWLHEYAKANPDV